MKLLHATAAANVPAILRRGLLASKSKAVIKSVWLATPGFWSAAVAHASKRHNLAPEAVAVLVVDVPRSWLRRAKRKGLWHTGQRNVTPERIEAVYTISRGLPYASVPVPRDQRRAPVGATRRGRSVRSRT